MTTNTKRNMISTSFGNVLIDSPSASISIFKQFIFCFLRGVFFRFL